MLPDRVSNPGPLTYESGALPIALRGPAEKIRMMTEHITYTFGYLYLRLCEGWTRNAVILNYGQQTACVFIRIRRYSFENSAALNMAERLINKHFRF